MLEWVHRGALSVVEIPAAAYDDVGSIVRKYADQDSDLADAALVWLAGQTGVRDVLTVDKADFSVYRLRGGKRFELLKWYS